MAKRGRNVAVVLTAAFYRSRRHIPTLSKSPSKPADGVATGSKAKPARTLKRTCKTKTKSVARTHATKTTAAPRTAARTLAKSNSAAGSTAPKSSVRRNAPRTVGSRPLDNTTASSLERLTPGTKTPLGRPSTAYPVPSIPLYKEVQYRRNTLSAYPSRSPGPARHVHFAPTIIPLRPQSRHNPPDIQTSAASANPSRPQSQDSLPDYEDPLECYEELHDARGVPFYSPVRVRFSPIRASPGPEATPPGGWGIWEVNRVPGAETTPHGGWGIWEMSRDYQVGAPARNRDRHSSSQISPLTIKFAGAAQGRTGPWSPYPWSVPRRGALSQVQSGGIGLGLSFDKSVSPVEDDGLRDDFSVSLESESESESDADETGGDEDVVAARALYSTFVKELYGDHSEYEDTASEGL